MSSGPALLIRADADRKSGIGHVARCLALAEGFREAGGIVHFVGRFAVDGLLRMVEGAGFRWHEIPARHPDPADLASTLAAAAALAAGGASGPPWIVLDGYRFDAGYHFAFRSRGYRLAVLDDYGVLRATPAQVLVNPNLSAGRFPYEVEPGGAILRGPRWALVRDRIRAARPTAWTPAGEHARHLLVTLGGTDPSRVTASLVRALRNRISPDCQVRVVVGPGAGDSAEIRSETAAAAGSWEVHESVRDMGSMFAWADIAVTAGGGTVWELACRGVPSLVVATAGNQEPGLDALSSAGFVVSLGTLASWDPDRAADSVAAVARDRAMRSSMSEGSRAMVDGEGARRLVRVLLSFDRQDAPSLRPVEAPDLFQLWTWANDPDARRNSFQPEPIPWATHLAWFQRITSSDSARLYLLEHRAIPMGVVRYERASEGEARVSFSVAAEFRGRGLGTKLLALSAPRAREDLKVRRLFGETFRRNEASRRTFLRAGFREACGDDPERVEYFQEEPAPPSRR